MHHVNKSVTGINRTIVSLGSNAVGNWGSPSETLARAVAELQQHLGRILHSSNTYITEPVGSLRQPNFYNKVLVLDTKLPAGMVLRTLKAMERRAGRRIGTGVRWGPRTLDIDIIDQGGRVTGRHQGKPGRTVLPVQAPLVLPHPQAHRRAFVLVPLLDVVPHWWHPILRQPGRRLQTRLPRRHGVRQA
jgi:2-amino-4-hydroxy-6-hydroxymethyldihydropteridine diphosphokinase